MTQCPRCAEINYLIMQDLLKEGLDVFDALLEIVAFPGLPDPLLLATSLEAIYMFLDNDASRKIVLKKVLSKIHDSAILLPYIRGPMAKDLPNLKYCTLWRKCEMK